VSLFDYTGQLQSGSTFQGTLEAESQERAEATLADMCVRVISLRPSRQTVYVAPLSLDDFLFFNEQISAMTKAGVPLQEGLRQLAADVGSRKLKRLLLELVGQLDSGTPLEQALSRLRSRFPTEYAGVVQAGLRSGDLGGTLYGLAAHLRLKSDLRRALVELGVYPLVVILCAVAVVVFLMRAVVPQIELTVMDMLGTVDWTMPGQSPPPSLPAASRWIFEISHVWPKVELVAIAVLVVLGLFILAIALPRGRPVREWILRHIPGIARVYWSSVLARFAHTSALAAFSGTPLPELLTASGAASGSPSLSRTTDRIARKLNAGESLEAAASDQRDLPALWTCVVSSTVTRGELPAALEELARTYELRARQSAGTVRIFLGPILLVAVGLLLGSVILGTALPVINLIEGLTA
jgi:type IV pilus assembly protein PilC